jgi:hypothetical protein
MSASDRVIGDSYALWRWWLIGLWSVMLREWRVMLLVMIMMLLLMLVSRGGTLFRGQQHSTCRPQGIGRGVMRHVGLGISWREVLSGTL